MAYVYQGRLYNLKQFIRGQKKKKSAKPPKSRFLISSVRDLNQGHPWRGHNLWLCTGSTLVFSIGDTRGRFVADKHGVLQWQEVPSE